MIDARDKRFEILEQLEEYIQLEGTEIGEACAALCRLASYTDYLDEKFVKALDKELASQLKMFKEGTKIVETTETYTRKVIDLEWL